MEGLPEVPMKVWVASWPLLGVVLSAQGTGITTADLVCRMQLDGNPVAGAQLALIHQGTGQRWQSRSDREGKVALRFLPPGPYRLVALGPEGSHLEHSLVLQVGVQYRYPLNLVRPLVQEVVASVGPESIRTQASGQITSQDLHALPINRRNVHDLCLSTPWAVSGQGPVTGGAPDSRLSFLGVSPRQNLFLVDGLDNNDLGNGTPRIPFSQEAIQEFQVLAGGGDAEYGRASGGTVNAITKRGSNTPSGSLFWFERPGGWDAQPPLGRSTVDLRLHQYGATAGGAFDKDRLFYFLAVERLDQVDRNVVSIDPRTAALAREAGFPLELGSLSTGERGLSLLARLDYLASASHTWGCTVVHASEENDNQIPWGGLAARSIGGRRSTRNLSLGLTHRWILDDGWVSEQRLQYTTRDNRLDPLAAPTQVQVDVLGAASFGTQRLAPQATLATYTQWTSTLTGFLEHHVLKAGIGLLESLNRGRVEDNFGGYYAFAALPHLGIPDGLSAFAAPNPFGGRGLPSIFVQAFGNPNTRFSAGHLSAFLQDEWQPTPSFLLRVGLRYDRERLPAFRNTLDYQALGQNPGTLDPVWGPTRLPDGPYPYSKLFQSSLDWSSQRLSPRFAFSWQVNPVWRCFGSAGVHAGTVNLGPVFGTRLSNGTEVVSLMRTLLDPPEVSPLISWADGDGLARHHRYTTPPLGHRMLVLPGTLRAPHTRQVHLGLSWSPSPKQVFNLDVLKARGKDFLNLRNVNAFLPFGQAMRRPDLRYGSVYRVDGTGESRFEALILSTQLTLGSTVQVQGSYTRSRAEDNFADWSGALPPMNTFDPDSEWGPSFQDQRHRFLVSLVWTSLDKAWSAAILARAGSGRPVSRLAGSDLNMDGDPTADRPPGVGRNRESTPWTRNLDLRVSRSFVLGRLHADAILDVFNLFNRANGLDIQNTLTSTTPPFGTVVRYAPMRQIQLGARLRY